MTKSRTAFAAVLFSLTILLGFTLGLFHDRLLGEGVSWNSLQSFFQDIQHSRHSRANDPSAALSQLRIRIGDWAGKLVANKELIFYVALAAIAVLTIMLIVAAARKQREAPKDNILETLKDEKERAENLARLKAEFLNHVSHELRTPLAVIIGYIECITDGLYGHLGTKHQEILEIVAKQSTQLKEMIDQILIYSRLDSNRQTVRIKEFPLSEIIQQLKDTFGFLCRQKNLDFRAEISNSSVLLSTDAERLKEILSNLIQNAIKYTDEGSITVRASTTRGNDKIIFEIADTGLGIPQTYLESIFEPFIQVHRSSTEMSRGGIGLGLSIVKKHVEQIKGTVTVTSVLSRGSIFTVMIPRVLNPQKTRSGKLFSLVRFAYARGTSKAAPVYRGAPSNAKLTDEHRATS